MKGKYGGPMPVDEFYQALYQDRAFFERHAITHIRAAFLYFTPCDQHGEPVTVRDQQGNPMDGYVTAGGYRSAADAYDAASLEPKSLCRGFKP